MSKFIAKGFCSFQEQKAQAMSRTNVLAAVNPRRAKTKDEMSYPAKEGIFDVMASFKG